MDELFWGYDRCRHYQGEWFGGMEWAPLPTYAGEAQDFLAIVTSDKRSPVYPTVVFPAFGESG
jgi:hypothetical protein